MGTITINGKKYEFTNEKNILTIIRNAGIEVPTLCYQPELSVFGACRLCTVEDDRGRCFASCSEEPRDGMVIYTHTERLRKHRKLIVELLLAASTKYSGPFCMVMRPRKVTTLSCFGGTVTLSNSSLSGSTALCTVVTLSGEMPYFSITVRRVRLLTVIMWSGSTALRPRR